jgi:hypothetical protein
MKARQGLYVALQSLKPGRDPPRNGTRSIANSGVHGLLNNVNDNWYKSHPYLWNFAGEISITTTKWHKWTQCSLHNTGPLCSVGWVPDNVRAHIPHKLLCEKRQYSNRQEAIMQTSIRSKTQQGGWKQRKVGTDAHKENGRMAEGEDCSCASPLPLTCHVTRGRRAIPASCAWTRARARSVCVSCLSLTLSRWA